MSEMKNTDRPVPMVDHLRSLFAAGGLGGPLVMLAVLVVAFSAASGGTFVESSNLFNILRQFSVPLVLSLGQTLVIMTAGIDLSVASMAALSACLMGVTYSQLGWPEWVAILVGCFTGLAIGFFNGFVISRLRVPDFVATLGMLTAARGAANIITNGFPVPNFAQAVAGRTMPPMINTLGGGSLGPVPVIFIVALVMVAISWFILNRTLLGRKLIAVGGNREAARVAGINVPGTRLTVYLLSGLFSAIGGMLMAGRIESASGLMAPGMELTTIAAVVVGGTALFGGEGRIGGTVIGLFILATLSNGLNILGVSSFWQDLTTGLAVIGVVALDQARRRFLGDNRSTGRRPTPKSKDAATPITAAK